MDKWTTTIFWYPQIHCHIDILSVTIRFLCFDFQIKPINGFLDSMLVFCNAHLMMKHTNDLAILCSTSSKR